MLAARGVAFGFPSREVGRDVDFTLGRGESLAILGANGAGKSTLLRTLLGVLAPRAGAVEIDGVPVATFSVAERAARIAYVPQQHVPAYAFTVLETVLMGRAAHLGVFARPGRADRDIAREALAMLRIEPLAARPITELSGGERQLAMIARALAQRAPILILDEPTANLDFGHRSRVLRELDRLRSSGLSIVFATHEPDHALAHADRALLLADGRPLALDSPLRALTPANLERLYATPVRLVQVENGRYACVSMM
jgi:iron complex transport system ATP-binding protein